MRGIPLWNFPAFDAARDMLIGLGHDPISPADIDREHGIDENTTVLPPGFIHTALRRDFAAIVTCDAIAFLPGWETSSGANAERTVGGHVGCEFWRVDPEARTFEREQIVGFSGYARAGKDTAANILVSEHGFTRGAFADALKESLYALNPMVLMGAGKRLQSVVMSDGWEKAKAITEVRELLQRLGTEAGRNVLGQDIWVETMFRRNMTARLTVSDVRFPNEAAAIRARGGQVIRIERPGTAPVNPHISETALDGFDFDAVIVNDGTVSDLAAQLDGALNPVEVAA